MKRPLPLLLVAALTAVVMLVAELAASVPGWERTVFVDGATITLHLGGPTRPATRVSSANATASGASVTPAPQAAAAGAAESKADRDRRMAWWRDARLGMFIHWGLYAVPAGDYQGKRSKDIGEWIMLWSNIPRAEYETFASRFNPVDFDAASWVRTAKDAGMKYIVITSKHHDGFSMFDSA